MTADEAECAEHCLRAGLNIIVDAAFLDAADRELFRALAERLGAHHFIVSCQADPTALARRVLERSAQRRDPSDATLEVLDHQLRRVKPFEPSEQAHVIAVATAERDPVRQVMTAIHARAARA
jgi:predicted kinase